jgi:hypothetical protein
MAAKSGYKMLLRTAQMAFREDHYTLSQARIKLKEEFMKQKNVTDPNTLSKYCFY